MAVRRFAAAWMLGLRVQVPLSAWIFAFYIFFCVFYRTAQLVQTSPTVRACRLERSSTKQRRPEMVCCNVTGLLKRKKRMI